MNLLDKISIYKYIEFIIFMLYLIFIFISIQIWMMWKDIDKDEWKSIVEESFLKKNLILIFSATIFFIIHEFLESSAIPNAQVIFEFSEVLALVSLVGLFHFWYNVLKPHVHRVPPVTIVRLRKSY
jgi:hypothetical protein